ncbi:hypothetical protein QJQ45_000509 [Haematococcus lacustris]|nr:hypothetical protein QJQ45_000509 [Haematococcus lacustris]
MQRIGESRWRPLGLGYWPEQGKLPAKGKEYPGLGYKRHLAAASSVVTFLEAKLKHITVNLATLDAVWEVCLDPKWARQRLMLYGAQNRALEQSFKKARLEKDMPEVPMERHNCAKQLVVFFGSAGIGTGGG